MAKTKYAVGVDLGGTSIKVGLVSEDGKIINKTSLDSLAKEGPEAVVGQIMKGIDEVLKGVKGKIEGIGIGSPGIVNAKKGIVENPPNFQGWEKVQLGKLLKKEFNTAVFVENDANVAAIGEMIYGAGKKLDYFIMITLGTGVGGGIIINRKIYRGESGAAGELGHVTIDHNGAQCKCGSLGCIEAYAGNNYLVERVTAELQDRPHSKLNDLIKVEGELTPKLIHDAALQNDEYSKQIIVDLGVKIGHAIASIINVLDIPNIIIGGGVAGFGDLLFVPLKDAVIDRVMIPMKPKIKIKAAKLLNQAGIKGASALVFYRK